MAKRSLQASPAGIQQAKRAFSLLGWTQDNLAAEVNLKTRQPIWRFFTGKPVDRQVFMEICHILDLEWRDIALNPPTEPPEVDTSLHSLDIDQLVKKARSQHRDTIQHYCGILQLLDINYPVRIDDIYLDVNILEAVQNQQWFELAELNNIEPTEFDRIGLGLIEQTQIPGMQAVETHPKLRVLGRPGVGKTTFLQHLAVQCNEGNFAADQVPVYITLREFAEFAKRQEDFSLFNYIRKTLVTSGISEPSVLETLLTQGRMLILMDGIDEVKSQDITTIIQEIRAFSDKYHRNRFVASCRSAAQKFCLRGFTDVEIAPFTQEQITTFARKWFTALSKTATPSGKAQAAKFIQKLESPENWKFRQLVETPLFLHLACWVFQGEGELPSKQTTFYKQGLDLLLGKWDETKGVERDNAYREFRLPQKIKLLSQLAAITFEKGQYFFEQRTIEQYIEDYLQNQPDTNLDSEELQLESEAILKSIEAQHGLLIERARGIFSFSYLVFQEYLTARNIVATHNLRSSENALGGLVQHITDPHWHEIFLLTASMLRSADSLVQLIKQEIDALIADDPYLQKFLDWANQKSQTIPSESKIAANRSFYLALAQNSQTTDHFALASTLDQGILLDAALENFLTEFSLEHNQSFDTHREALSNILVMVQDTGFYKSLQQLKNELPTSYHTQRAMQTWWQQNYPNWMERLKVAITHYRNISHPWEFSAEQQKILKRYYDANQLLVDCLNSNAEITPTIRQEIEATLLMPQQELEEREWQGNNQL